MKSATLVALLCMLPATAAPADTVFHVGETVIEDEVSPRHAHHVTRWEGDYFVSDTDVSVLGWGSKGGGTPIPFETPHVHDGSTTTSGFTSIFHRLPDGIEVVITYDSFVLDRRVVRTGRNACAMTVTATLRPGHIVFEVHGISNHEQMTEVTRVYTGLSCAFPKLLG